MYRDTDDCHTVRHPARAVADLRGHLPDGAVTVGLADGDAALLRPLRSGEYDVLDDVFLGMSQRSRRQRFLVPMPRLPGASRRTLADVDGARHVAWVALVGGHPVGICRYVRTAPGTAEIAFEVVDDHQGRGIGSALLDAVATVAYANGITCLEASVDPDNAASIALLTRVGIELAPEDGVLVGRGPVHLMDPPRSSRLAVLHLAAAAAAGAAADSEQARTH